MTTCTDELLSAELIRLRFSGGSSHVDEDPVINPSIVEKLIESKLQPALHAQ